MAKRTGIAALLGGSLLLLVGKNSLLGSELGQLKYNLIFHYRVPYFHLEYSRTLYELHPH